MTRDEWELTCEEALRSLEEYVDGELPPLLALRVEEHLKRCPGCPKKVELERAFRGLLRRQRERGPGPRRDLWERIQAALQGDVRGLPDSTPRSAKRGGDFH